MNYRKEITKEMKLLGEQKDAVFIGEGLKNAGDMFGTLSEVPISKTIEMPVAENLIMGTAIGLALKGLVPIVVFQRMDFMLVAADAIINHLVLIEKQSGGQFKPKVIIRAIIGSRNKKFWVGEQHNHDFMDLFSPYIFTEFYRSGIYKESYSGDKPVLIVEDKDEY